MKAIQESRVPSQARIRIQLTVLCSIALKFWQQKRNKGKQQATKKERALNIWVLQISNGEICHRAARLHMTASASLQVELRGVDAHGSGLGKPVAPGGRMVPAHAVEVVHARPHRMR